MCYPTIYNVDLFECSNLYSRNGKDIQDNFRDNKVNRIATNRVLQLQVVHDGVHGAGVHELARGEDLAQVGARLPERLEHGREVAQTQEGHVDGARPGRAVDGHARDEAERALAADEEVLQVVPGVVLWEQ